MKRGTVAGRISWSFALVFLCGLLIIAAAAYYEFKVEHDDPLEATIEVALEAVVCMTLLSYGGWWLVRRALRPLDRLTAAAGRIHEGNLAERISLPGSGAEFEQLAGVLNGMTLRLDASFQRVRQFSLYASHELKTPLSILRVEMERMADEPGRSEADQNALARQLDEIERLAGIVDGLTFLTRADSNLIPMEKVPVDLRPLVESAAEDTAALGEGEGIEITVDRCDEVCWQGDRHRLRQLLVILCDNAVKYNRPGGRIRIRLERRNGESALLVMNTGAGIPLEDYERVFERFYRGSGNLANGTEGCGLGLSIAQWIMRQHGGTLDFASSEDSTEFMATVPDGPRNGEPLSRTDRIQ